MKKHAPKLFERYDLVSLGADIASGKGLVEGLRDQEASITQSKRSSRRSKTSRIRSK